jgi:SAM-dependent methyltransferase
MREESTHHVSRITHHAFMLDPTAFDAFANDYDQDFTHTRLGQLLRPRVWSHLATHFKAGDRVLELACGTGEDAVWLAKQGVQVIATDGSAEMVRVTREKGENAGILHNLTPLQIKLQAIHTIPTLLGKQYRMGRPFGSTVNELLFDGVFSNFGGINTIADWGKLAADLAKLVRPSGKVILVPMGKVCFWEMKWYAFHFQFGMAFRRFRQPAIAKIGDAEIPIWYPSGKVLRQAFAPHFRHLHTESLGLWLPPSYLDQFVERFPRLFTHLNNFERATAGLTGSWGDHFVCVFERRV